MPKTLHLITQDDQPYGSVRKSCENCGTWIIGNSAKHLYAEDRGDFNKLIESGEYKKCELDND